MEEQVIMGLYQTLVCEEKIKEDKKMNKLQSYEEWLLSSGETEELGVNTLFTFMLLKQLTDGAVDRTFEIMRDAFKGAFFEKGLKSKEMTFYAEDDPCLRARELGLLVKAEIGATPEEFVGVVYAQARDFYNQVEMWKNKSLWGYIKHWFVRRK